MRRQVVLAATVLLVGLGVRLHGLQQAGLQTSPGSEPERVAAALAAGRGWSDAFGIGTGPTAHVVPLYPLLLSGVYRLCGDYETETGRWAQQSLSIGLSLLIPLFLPVLARKLGLSSITGWTAALVKACWMTHHEISGHHENVLAALALLGLIWCCADLRQRGWRGRGPLARMGILLGLTALLCPNFLLVPALFLLGEFGLHRAERRIFRCGSMLALIGLLVVVPWLVRNYRVLGGFVPLRSNFGLELAVGNRPNADGWSMGPGFNEIHPIRSAAERARLIQLGELSYVREKQRQALTWISENPRQFAWLTWQRVAIFYFIKGEYSVDVPFLGLRMPVSRLMVLATALSLLWLVRRNPWVGRLLIGTFLGAGLPYFLTHVNGRYRESLVGLSLLVSVNLFVSVVLWLRGKPSAFLVPGVRTFPPEPTTSSCKSSFDLS